MFKISHEVPICLLKESIFFNDYDYILFHLLEEYPEYENFYKKNIEKGREAILDNSAYEYFIKGEELNLEKFAEKVEELKPSHYILPDKLNDYKTTLRYMEEWDFKYKNLHGKRIGVVQGATLPEFIDCYTKIKNNVDKIGISFGYSFLPSLIPETLGLSLNKYQTYSLGRIYLLQFLLLKGVIDEKKPHHLLGSYLPVEFLQYTSTNYSFIESIDTAFPVKNGLNLQKIYMNGSDKKEEILIDSFIKKDLTFLQKECILNNIKTFRGAL